MGEPLNEVSKSHPNNLKWQVNAARSEFIESYYRNIFGDEEMSDPIAALRPEEVTTVLMAYENHLATHGLLKHMKQVEE